MLATPRIVWTSLDGPNEGIRRMEISLLDVIAIDLDNQRILIGTVWMSVHGHDWNPFHDDHWASIDSRIEDARPIGRV